jgi:hypothetical protein
LGSTGSHAAVESEVPGASADRLPLGPEPSAPRAGGWSRTALLALVLGVLAVLWVVQNEVVHSSIQVGNAVPPIPALAALLVLAAAARIALRRQRGRARAEAPSPPGGRVLFIYILITVAAAIPSTASMSFFFAFLTVPQYLARSQPPMARVAALFPRWLAPPAGEPIRRFFEGSADGVVPWSVWVLPLLAWGAFLFTLMLTLYALLALLRRPWMESERLSYPMVQIPLRLMGETTRGVPPLWRDPVMWIGFGLESAFDGMNMLNAFRPSFPSMGTSFNIGALFPDKPWSSLAPFVASYRPEIFGIAYLMPTEVLLTTGVSYLLLRFSTVVRVAAGEQVASTAYDYQELGMGAFLCLFALLIWRAQPELSRTLGEALGWRRRRGSRDEPLSPRAAWGILLLGSAAMVVWLRLTGLPVWASTAHLGLIIAVAVVYARMRAETGAPMIYLFPFWQQQNLLTNFFGSLPISGGSERALAAFASLGGLSRGFYPEICAYGSEGMSLAAHARFPQRRVTQAVVAGLVIGLVLGGYLYLTAYYRDGANLLDGGGGRGGYRVFLATQQYNSLIQMLDSPAQPKPDRIVQTFLGAGIVLSLNFLRQRLFWFPFHPMGFAMASAYGYHLWAPFLMAWFLKTLILRLSGQLGYRRLVPLFLGFALGRYLFAGIVWGILGLTGHPATTTYRIHFG